MTKKKTRDQMLLDAIRANKKQIARTLVETRERLGLTRYEVCQKACIEYRTLDNVESGITAFTIDTLLRLGEVYEIDFAQIWISQLSQ